MIMTTDERLASIESALKKLAGDSVVQEESLEGAINEKLSLILTKVEKIGVTNTGQTVDVEPTTEDDASFIKVRDNQLFWITCTTIIMSVVSFYYVTGLFAIVIGLLFGVIMVHGSVILDNVIFQGNTLKRIAKSGIGAAIYIAAIIYAIGSGIDVGTSLLTDPLSNDESRKTSIGRTTDPVERAEQVIAKPDTTKQDTVATEN